MTKTQSNSQGAPATNNSQGGPATKMEEKIVTPALELSFYMDIYLSISLSFSLSLSLYIYIYMYIPVWCCCLPAYLHV